MVVTPLDPLAAPPNTQLALGLYLLWIVGEGTLHLAHAYQPAGADRQRAALGWLQGAFFSASAYGWLDATTIGVSTLPDSLLGLSYAASGFTLLAVTLRVAARRTIGKNFSAYVQTNDRHLLITHGLYSRVRHPAYTAFLGMLIGFPLTLGSLGSLAIGLGVGLPALVVRIRAEEIALERWFGDEWRSYASQTWRLLPGVW